MSFAKWYLIYHNSPKNYFKKVINIFIMFLHYPTQYKIMLPLRTCTMSESIHYPSNITLFLVSFIYDYYFCYQ